MSWMNIMSPSMVFPCREETFGQEWWSIYRTL
jgi:hypothetical protein